LPKFRPKSHGCSPLNQHHFKLSLISVPVLLALSIASGQHRFLENGNPVSRGSDAGYLLDTPYRAKIDLSGTWNFTVEGGPTGTIKVPSAFDFVGKVTFERNFEITSEHIDKYQFFLAMFGVNHACEVSLNGDFLTTHSGGYTSFFQPIPANNLQLGTENVIRVEVNNQLDPRRTLPLRSNLWGWRNYGGILRDVFIMAVPKMAISEVVVSSEYSRQRGAAKIDLDVAFEGSFEPPAPAVPSTSTRGAPSLAMYVEMLDKITGFQVAKTPLVPLVRTGNEWERVRSTATAENPKLWSPESPELYIVKVYLVYGTAKEFTILDEYDLNHGIRSLEVKEGTILLNGKRVVLKGVIWYEEHPDFGSAMSYEELEKDVALIKSLGANTVRFANHPPHPYMLNLCDRYGLFALEELPLSGSPSSVLAEEDMLELAGTMMKEMVGRDRQHVSVLAWGIGDEFESSTPAARTFVESLVGIVKTLDGRPTYYGTRLLGSDVCSDLVDIVAVNAPATDVKLFKKELEEWKRKNKNRPLVVGRLGTEVQQDNRNGYSDPLSYEAQARFYIQRFDVLKSLEYDGAMIWSFNDWKGDRPSLTVNAEDPWMRCTGLVSYDRQKRLAYDAVRAVFRGEKFVALPMGNYSAGAPIIFVVSGLVVLIGTAYFYNANRRFRDNLNRSVMNLYNFFSDVRDQRIVSLLQTTLLGLIISVASAIVLSSILYHFRQNWVLDNLLSFLLVSNGLKESVVLLVWDPLKSITYFSAFVFLAFISVYILVMLLSVVSKAKIFSYHAFVVTIWSAAPLLVLVPVGMILYRVMDSPMYVMPSLVFLALLVMWVLLRLLKGISIIFDVYVAKVYIIGFLSLAGVATVVFMYFDYTQSASMYLSYMYRVMMEGQ
jgi:hypothetical protein